MTTEIQKYADVAMFDADPMFSYGEETGVTPDVYLLWMTPRPLAAMAAMNEMYRGHVVRDLDDISDDAMQQALDDMSKTHLTAPMEAIKFHFMIEGVDRAFTHQHVRQRTAAYAQESLRFAVIQDLLRGITYPPSLFGTKPGDTSTMAGKNRQKWDECVTKIQETYEYLVANGMAQEDARGLLPHCTATRLNYVTDLRNMVDHAGNRLCTQAQFHWRAVFTKITASIVHYGMTEDEDNLWQYQALADSPMFRPKCFQIGKCGFKGTFDRHCNISEKVAFLERNRVPTEEWDSEIPKHTWLLDPEAARIPEG